MIVSLCILQDPHDSIKIESLYSKLKKHRTTVERMLARILVKKYPPKTEYVSMKNILDWDLWPLLITIHSMFIIYVLNYYYNPYIFPCIESGHMVDKDGGENWSQSSLPEHTELVCTLAESTLEDFFSKCTSTISIEDVKMVENRESQIIKLHSATITCSPGEKKSKAEEFSSLIQQRIQQVKNFTAKKNILASLCRKLSTKQSPIIEGNHCDIYTFTTKSTVDFEYSMAVGTDWYNSIEFFLVYVLVTMPLNGCGQNGNIPGFLFPPFFWSSLISFLV